MSNAVEGSMDVSFTHLFIPNYLDNQKKSNVAVRLIEYNEPHKRFITDYQFTTVKTPLHVLSKQLDVVFLRNQQLIIPKVLRTLCLPASTIGLSSNILSHLTSCSILKKCEGAVICENVHHLSSRNGKTNGPRTTITSIPPIQ